MLDFTSDLKTIPALNNHDIAIKENVEHSNQSWQNVQAVLDAMRQQELTQQEKFIKRKKMLPRDRVQTLLDPGSIFIEIAAIAGYQMFDDKDGSMAGGGIIAGIGQVSGTFCMIVASNSAIKGGTISPIGLEKSLRVQEIALQQKLPLITLAESGGANLNYASDIFVEGAKGFANQARLSAAGVPQVTVVHGNATAGGAYQPALSDYVILVENQSHMYLAGPPLVYAAIGEQTDDESLGGTQLHSQITGTGDFLAADDFSAIQMARRIVKSLNWQTIKIAEHAVEPLHCAQELLGVIPHDSKKPYKVQELLVRLVDNSEFLEFKPEYDQHTFCGFSKFGAIDCGIIGNNGPITAAGASKAAHFIQLCEQTNRPLVFLHNTTGFMVGTDSERAAVIKQGAKLIQAVTNAKVPKISIIVGGSYGAGNYAMCGRGINPDFIFAWPNSRTSVMGGDQAGKVMKIVAEQKQKRAGMVPDSKVLDFLEQSTKTKIDKESTAMYGSARLWDDGLIHPLQTRGLLIHLLHLATHARQLKLTTTSFGIPRH